VKYGNLIGIPLLFVLIGAWRLVRRRQLQTVAYEPRSRSGPGEGTKASRDGGQR
jgi:hypothetical protein